MNRYDIINQFIQERKFKSYLEIGTYMGESFLNVRCDRKVSIDPDPESYAMLHVTSDEFFSYNTERFDIIFIDGLHEYQQAFRDIIHSLHCLSHNGVIVIHDCHPTSEEMQMHSTVSRQGYEWTGDVWKAFVLVRAVMPYEIYVIDHDYGCGIIDTAMRKQSHTANMPTDMSRMTYSQFVQHPEWMNFKRGIIHE